MTANGVSRLVAYYRVSTERQGCCGLGLDAQQEAVRAFNGGRRTSPSTSRSRAASATTGPKLAEALRLCRLHGARAGDRQARPAGPQRCLHLEPDGERGGVRRGATCRRRTA